MKPDWKDEAIFEAMQHYTEMRQREEEEFFADHEEKPFTPPPVQVLPTHKSYCPACGQHYLSTHGLNMACEPCKQLHPLGEMRDWE